MSDEFDAVERLEKFYGKIPEEEKAWIDDNINSLSDEQKGKFYKALTTVHEFKNGYPEISTMAEVFKKTMNKAPKNYAWSVCMECGCEYDYKLPCCPSCYDKGLFCNAIAVKTSNIKPNIIQYNKTYRADGTKEVVCYDCINKADSFCKHFGNENWNCNDFRTCKCAGCCIRAKRANAVSNKEQKKISYAIPLKKV